MPVCGPKLSLCGLVLSVWGVLQLTVMGIFFYTHSVAFVEDLKLKDNSTYSSEDELLNDMEEAYQQNALNCWIAALLYVVTLCVSAQQFWMNNRQSNYSI